MRDVGDLRRLPRRCHGGCLAAKRHQRHGQRGRGRPGAGGRTHSLLDPHDVCDIRGHVGPRHGDPEVWAPGLPGRPQEEEAPRGPP